MQASDPRIIVALDFAAAEPAVALARRLDPARCRVKVGKELFTSAGPAVVDSLQRLGFGVFLDLKFHDIPNTVAGACRAAAAMGVWMVNVHALGGRSMMSAAREALAASPTLLVAVTVLTSLRADDLREIGIDADPPAEVERLATLAHECGLHGVVCSAQEAPRIKARLGDGFLAVTPGIRPAQSGKDDQARIVTPSAAIAAGADHLVIGRPITAAPDPLAALAEIERELQTTGASA